MKTNNSKSKEQQDRQDEVDFYNDNVLPPCLNYSKYYRI